MKTTLRGLIPMLLAVTVVVSAGGPASASPPSNDVEARAIGVDTVPFTHSVDTSDANADGPRFCSSHASVFYTFTPSATVRVQVDTLGSDYDTTLAIYTRDDVGKVGQIGCDDDRFGEASGLRLRAVAGTTYVVMVSRCCGNPREGRPGRPGGPLVLTVTKFSSASLDATLTIDRGTVDPNEGIATISGTITCSMRSIVYTEGVLRQLRQEVFVARGYWYADTPCTPDAPVPWSMDVDTETSVVFGTGPATSRRYYLEAYAGWHTWFGTYEEEVSSLQLV
jgi:hypothetical protein